MADYQNLFTQVQAVTHPHSGVAIDPRDMGERTKNPFLLHLAGRLGNAQIEGANLGITETARKVQQEWVFGAFTHIPRVNRDARVRMRYRLNLGK